MPFTEESMRSVKCIDYGFYHPAMGRCSSLFANITISPKNHLFACCGLPVKYIPYFDLGDLTTLNIRQGYNKQFEDFIKIWIYVEGAYEILSYIEKRSKMKIPELRVLSHMCFYCAALLTNPQYINAAKEYYKEKYGAVMLKFYLLTKKYNNEKAWKQNDAIGRMDFIR